MSDLNPRNTQSSTRPEHHLHDSPDPLQVPGAYGGDQGVDRDVDNMATSQRLPDSQDTLGVYGNSAPAVSQEEERMRNEARARASDTEKRSERPLAGVQPVRQGGVTFGGRENEEPQRGKSGLSDKVIGKAQQVMGKLSNNPEMHEKGELREAGGKAASGRAPHD